jgi:hypothetical protein
MVTGGLYAFDFFMFNPSLRQPSSSTMSSWTSLESALALRGWLPAARVASFFRVVVKYHAQTRVDSSDI